MWRDGAPSAGSAFTTSAPSPASRRPQYSADSSVSSSTRTASSGARHDSAPSAARSGDVVGAHARAPRPAPRRCPRPGRAGPGAGSPPVCGGVADMRKGTPSRGSGVHLGVAEHGVVTPGRELRVALEAVGGVLHRAGGHPDALEEVHDVVAVARRWSTPRAGRRGRRRARRVPSSVAKRGSAAHVGPAHGLDEGLPLLLGAARHHHPLVVAPGAVRARRARRGDGPGGCRWGSPGRRLGRPLSMASRSSAPDSAVAGSSWETSMCWPSPGASPVDDARPGWRRPRGSRPRGRGRRTTIPPGDGRGGPP